MRFMSWVHQFLNMAQGPDLFFVSLKNILTVSSLFLTTVCDLIIFPTKNQCKNAVWLQLQMEICVDHHISQYGHSQCLISVSHISAYVPCA